MVGINAAGCSEYSRKQIDELTDFVKRPQVGASGLVYIRYGLDKTIKSSVDKFYSPEELAAIMVQGTNASISDNICIHSVRIDCKHTVSASAYGDYGLLAYWVRNYSVVNCEFHNEKSCAIKAANINAFI